MDPGFSAAIWGQLSHRLQLPWGPQCWGNPDVGGAEASVATRGPEEEPGGVLGEQAQSPGRCWKHKQNTSVRWLAPTLPLPRIRWLMLS